MKIIEGRYFSELTALQESGASVVVPAALPWYPARLAYQLNVTRKEIRREESLHRLHNFLVRIHQQCSGRFMVACFI